MPRRSMRRLPLLRSSLETAAPSFRESQPMLHPAAEHLSLLLCRGGVASNTDLAGFGAVSPLAGTEGSNPVPSSAESGNFRSLARRARVRATVNRCNHHREHRPPATTDGFVLDDANVPA